MHISRQPPMLRKGLAGLLLAVALATSSIYLVRAAPSSQSAGEGEVIYREKCASCHTIGAGPLVGPDLLGVTLRRERDWLVRWIAAPDEVLTEGDPIATRLLEEYNNLPMPNVGLTEAGVAAIVAYLENQDQSESPRTQSLLAMSEDSTFIDERFGSAPVSWARARPGLWTLTCCCKLPFTSPSVWG